MYIHITCVYIYIYICWDNIWQPLHRHTISVADSSVCHTIAVCFPYACARLLLLLRQPALSPTCSKANSVFVFVHSFAELGSTVLRHRSIRDAAIVLPYHICCWRMCFSYHCPCVFLTCARGYYCSRGKLPWAQLAAKQTHCLFCSDSFAGAGLHGAKAHKHSCCSHPQLTFNYTFTFPLNTTYIYNMWVYAQSRTSDQCKCINLHFVAGALSCAHHVCFVTALQAAGVNGFRFFQSMQ